MPLTIVQRDGLDCPVVVCEHCGEEIADAHGAIYAWAWATPGGPIVYLHKSCARAFERAHGGRWGWAPLICFPAYLGEGLGLDWREARRWARVLAGVEG